MLCRPALLVLLMLALVAGCAADPAASSLSWYERTSPLQGPTGSDVVQIDIALLDQSLGDRYVNEDLWPLVDEQFVPLDRKRVLTENGFRVGLVSGITPEGLQAMLTSPRSNPNPREKHMRAGNTSSVELGPVLEHCRFAIKQEKDKTAPVFELKQALCTLELSPSLTPDGRTRLRFVPRIVYEGSPGLRGISAESINWLARQQRPAENFDALTFDVVVAANEYVVIGGRYDRPGTLGYACFARSEEVNPVQRLLAIRVTRLEPEAVFDSLEQKEALQKTPPLALQAVWTTSHGVEASP
ncbi:MAG: hypothetical protein ACJ8FY_16450 [Gemmataceae bacterium]